MRTIFFMGKPGSGKGDQAKLLAEATKWTMMNLGETLRGMAAEGTRAGRKMKADMDAGLLLPSWLPGYLFIKTMFALGDNESIILDGFARKVPEAKLIIEELAWLERPFAALYLNVSDEEIEHRIALRKKVEERADDANDHIVQERLKEYRTNTKPAIEVFREAGKLIEINGEGTREKIAADVRKALNIQNR